jgi:hypothetical protein
VVVLDVLDVELEDELEELEELEELDVLDVDDVVDVVVVVVRSRSRTASTNSWSLGDKAEAFSRILAVRTASLALTI